jgi:hypothetical protein
MGGRPELYDEYFEQHNCEFAYDAELKSEIRGPRSEAGDQRLEFRKGTGLF